MHRPPSPQSQSSSQPPTPAPAPEVADQVKNARAYPASDEAGSRDYAKSKSGRLIEDQEFWFASGFLST